MPLIKKVNKKLFSIAKSISFWRARRTSVRDKNLLIVGNGPSTNRLCPQKTEAWLDRGNDLAVCNGYFYRPRVQTRPLHTLFGVTDPDIETIVRLLVVGVSWQVLFDDYESGALRRHMKVPELNYQTFKFDLESLRTALDHKDMWWLTSSSMVRPLNALGIKKIIPIGCISLSTSWPAMIRSMVVQTGMMRPWLVNPIGPSVISQIIIAGIALGYRRIYIIGHADETNWKTFFYLNDKRWAFDYRYYWDTTDRKIERTDSYYLFRKGLVRTLLVEKAIESRFPGRIRYLSPTNQHVFHNGLNVPDLLA